MAQMASHNSALASGGAGGAGAQAAKVFSLSSFIGQGLDQAGLFKILGDEKDTFSPLGNITGVGELLGNARGGPESIFKKMSEIFKSKEEAWDAATFMKENKEGIAGPDSPDWKKMAADPANQGAPIDPNNDAFRNLKPVQSAQNDIPQGLPQPFGNNGSGGDGGGGGAGGGDGAQRPGMFDTVFQGNEGFVNMMMDNGGIVTVSRDRLGQLAPDGTASIGGLGRGTPMPGM